MSIGGIVLGPAYLALGRDATLTVAGVDYPVRVIYRSSGAGVGGDLAIETLVPLAAVRAADLASANLLATDLDDATLTLGEDDWRITSVRPLPSPGGEGDGEYLLLLERARDPEPI